MPFEPQLPIDPVKKALKVEGVTGGTPIPVVGVAGATSDVTLHDNATPAQHLGINASGQAAIQNPPNLDVAASTLATQATLALIKAKTDNLDVALSTRTKPADTQKVDGSAVTQPVSGTFWQATQPVSGPLTDTQLRATAVPVSGPLTDTQLRATAVPVSGTVTANQGTAAATSAAWPIKVTDTSDVAVKPGDATNNAIRVNVVASTGSTTFFGITESSTGDGVTATLTLGHTPTDEPRVFVGRIRQILNTDYTRAGAVITWIVIPPSGDSIQVDYTWSMASATLAATLVVDTLGNVQPTGDSSARTIHTTLDNSTLPLPTGAATEATLALEMSAAVFSQRLLYAQLATQRAALQMQAIATGQAMFLPELPSFLGA